MTEALAPVSEVLAPLGRDLAPVSEVLAPVTGALAPVTEAVGSPIGITFPRPGTSGALPTVLIPQAHEPEWVAPAVLAAPQNGVPGPAAGADARSADGGAASPTATRVTVSFRDAGLARPGSVASAPRPAPLAPDHPLAPSGPLGSAAMTSSSSGNGSWGGGWAAADVPDVLVLALLLLAGAGLGTRLAPLERPGHPLIFPA